MIRNMIVSTHIVHQSCKFLIYSHKTMQIMECMEETGIVPGGNWYRTRSKPVSYQEETGIVPGGNWYRTRRKPVSYQEETGIVPGGNWYRTRSKPEVIDKFVYKIRDNMTNNENRFQSFFY